MAIIKETLIPSTYFMAHSKYMSEEQWQKYLEEIDKEIHWLKEWEKDIDNRHKDK